MIYILWPKKTSYILICTCITDDYFTGISMPKDKIPTLLNYLHSRENALLQKYFRLASLNSWKYSVPLTDDCLQAALLLSCTTFSASLWETRWHHFPLPPQNIWSSPSCSCSLMLPLPLWGNCVGVTALSCCCNWLSHVPAPCPVPAGACGAAQWARAQTCLKPKIWDFQINFWTVSWAAWDQNPYYSCGRRAPSKQIQTRDKFLLLWYRVGLAY